MSDPSSDPQSIELLIKDLVSKDPLKCQKARQALIEIGSPAVPHLIKVLETGRDWMRWEAAKSLSEIADPEAIPTLVEALRDKMFEVRWLAAKGLINIGWRSVTPLINSLMEHPESVWMRDGAHHVMHDLARDRLKEPLQPILESLEGIEPAVNIPLAGRAVLEKLHPIEAQIIEEEEEAKRRAEEEAALEAEEAKAEANLRARPDKEQAHKNITES